MITTTSYGTWNNVVDPLALTVEQTVCEALGDYADDYDVEAIAADYRDAINRALPEGVSLCGDEFIGPAYAEDATWGPELETDGGRLDIKRIVDTVDFWEIVARHETSMTAYTDPTGMPESERMTPAEFRVIREFLGLSIDALASYFGVTGRTVRYWEAGAYPIPDWACLELEKLEAHTAEIVADVVEQLIDVPDPVVVTYRNDAEYHAAHPGSPLTASWHRAVIARVAQEVPGLTIVYPPREERP